MLGGEPAAGHDEADVLVRQGDRDPGADQAAFSGREHEGLGGHQVGPGVTGLGEDGGGGAGPEDVDCFGHESRVVQTVTDP
ncbi:hypothetical protein GCM10009627_25430 [Curtobacterium herbarum]|uniref:Uncharacterized protein n=1 Tax=Curtobacterium herbarum TaxID=150122 RepID=A0ABN1ZER5_9MICO